MPTLVLGVYVNAVNVRTKSVSEMSDFSEGGIFALIVGSYMNSWCRFRQFAVTMFFTPIR